MELWDEYKKTHSPEIKEALILKEIEVEEEFNNNNIMSKRTAPIDINGKIYSGD